MPRCLHLHVSRGMHSRGIIPDLERPRMSNPLGIHTQGIENYFSMIQGTNKKFHLGVDATFTPKSKCGQAMWLFQKNLLHLFFEVTGFIVFFF